MAKTHWKAIDGTVTSVEEKVDRERTFYVISFNYKVGEHWYGGYFTGDMPYQAGDRLPVQYDPLNPEKNDLEQRETRSHWILRISIVAGIVLAILCAALGGASKR